MKTVIYDPRPSTNDYLSEYFLAPLHAYMRDSGRDVAIARSDLLSIRNARLCIDTTNLGRFPGDYPVKGLDIVEALRHNGNKLCVFDINDHSSLGFWDLDLGAIDCIFKVAGVQLTDASTELHVANDLSYTVAPREFLPAGINRSEYARLRDADKILSLPYPMDDHFGAPGVAFSQREKRCLVRGGAHFKRVLLFFHLLQKGLADTNSAFDVQSYAGSMCSQCQLQERAGGYSYHTYKQRPVSSYGDCTNPGLRWWEDLPEDFFRSGMRWALNNRCHPLYFWLTDKFTARYGAIDTGAVSQVFNNRRVSTRDLHDLLGRYLFYGDFKWIFSIYAPQRFWAAARAGTINLLPSRAAEQRYFPEVREGDHFLTFREDFSDLDKLHDVRSDQWAHITDNCRALYERYIRFDRYRLSTHLMDEIIRRIEA